MFAKSLPSLFTIANLSLGMLAILLVFEDRPGLAAMMIILAMLTDGVDGRVARALNVQSEFGKELDSLSDVISFGVAPAFIVFVVALQDLGAAGWFATALFPICGALRLARFNVSSSTPGYFIGLPIPAAGGVLATLALFYQELSVAVLLTATVALAVLMVSFVKYPDFKKVHFSNFMLVLSFLVVLTMIGLLLFKPDSIGTVAKLVLVPLVLYALYGLKKNVDLLLRLFVRIFLRKRRKSSKPPVDETAEV